MTSPMKLLLDKLLAEAEHNVVKCQIMFQPGGQAQAGAVKKGPIDGTYAFGSVVEEIGPDNRPTGNAVMINQYFAADAIQRIAVEMTDEETEILQPSRIVTPGTH
jgi:hypothetical protein